MRGRVPDSMYTWVAAAVILVSLAAAEAGRRRALGLALGPENRLHSKPRYHAAHCGLRAAIFGFGALFAAGVAYEWHVDSELESTALTAMGPGAESIEIELAISDGIGLAEGEITSRQDAVRERIAERYEELDPARIWLVGTLAMLASLAAAYFAYRRIAPNWQARNRVETLILLFLLACAGVAVLTTIGIVLSLLGETLRFFTDIPFTAFLFGLDWAPLSGVFHDELNVEQVGAVPLFAGTAMITLIAIFVAAPVGLLSAIYLAEFASPQMRGWTKPLLEILAGVPTVVYGFFAALTLAPILRDTGALVGVSVASESALAAGLVMGIMIIPFISSLSDDVINAVPQALRDGSMALGATKAETVRKVILPAALPGIASAILLGISRAVGETMIVVMAVGQGANLTANPLQTVTTVTVQIVALITGDIEAETASGPAFALGFTLFCITLALNVAALRFVRRYREMYE